MIPFEEGWTFDDILLVPQYSEIESREKVSLTTEVFKDLTLKVPIIAANMDTICGPEMVMAMQDSGGLGILHRYASYEKQQEWFGMLKNNYFIVPSVGVSTQDLAFAREIFPKYGITAVCLDIAHGHSKMSIEAIKMLKYWGFNVIAGNVATSAGYSALKDAGADYVKVGVGPGSVCTTRSVTGHGVPQAYAIHNIINSKPKYNIQNAGLLPWFSISEREPKPIIADGGLNSSGDIAKAIALGAPLVMTGSLLKGTLEVPEAGRSTYRGMASAEAQYSARGRVSNNAAEGQAVPIRTMTESVKDVMARLTGGLRSALSYSGANNIKEFQDKVIIMKVSNSTRTENGVRP